MTTKRDFVYGLIAIFCGVSIVAYLGTIDGFGWLATLGGGMATVAGLFFAGLAAIVLVKKIRSQY